MIDYILGLINFHVKSKNIASQKLQQSCKDLLRSVLPVPKISPQIKDVIKADRRFTDWCHLMFNQY